MISKIEFQNIANSFSVDATYTSVYDYDYGTTETSNEIGILAQEARTVSFTLIFDAFLESLLVDNKSLVYKVFSYNNDDTVNFSGILKERDGIVIDYEKRTVKITIYDIFYFIKDAGELTNEQKTSIDTNITVILGLIAGLKSRLEFVCTPYWHYMPGDLYYAYNNVELIQEDAIVSKTLGDSERSIIFRAKVKNANNEEVYFNNTTDSNFVFTQNEDAQPCDQNYEIIEDPSGWKMLRFHWIDRNSIELIGTNGKLKRVKKYFFNYYIKSSGSAFDDYPTPILGDLIKFKQTYKSAAYGSVFIPPFDYRFFHRCARKVDSWTDATLFFVYWNVVTENIPQCKRIIKKMNNAVQTIGVNGTNDDNEFLAIVKAQTKDYQQSFYVDYYVTDSDDGTKFLTLKLMYLSKAWGTVWCDIPSGWDERKGNNYLFRARTLKLKGFSVFYDDWDST